MHSPLPLIRYEHLDILCHQLWPDVHLYEQQVALIRATLEQPDTAVPAGNKLGKDFAAAFLALTYFMVARGRKKSCRIVTTSVAEHHLKVLWGEIARFLTTSKVPLIASRGGPLVVNHLEIR